jgi:hypothetical protein
MLIALEVANRRLELRLFTLPAGDNRGVGFPEPGIVYPYTATREYDEPDGSVSVGSQPSVSYVFGQPSRSSDPDVYTVELKRETAAADTTPQAEHG